MTASTLGIVELGDVCARMRARSLDLFELLGDWVTTTAPGDEQRLFAEACHRHAWHADLWAERSPAIPPVDLDAATAAARSPLPDAEPERRAGEYAAILDGLLDGLTLLAARIDEALDPSTVRTIDVVSADLAALRIRLGDYV